MHEMSLAEGIVQIVETTAQANDVDATRKLNWGFIDLNGVVGPHDLLRCKPDQRNAGQAGQADASDHDDEQDQPRRPRSSPHPSPPSVSARSRYSR